MYATFTNKQIGYYKKKRKTHTKAIDRSCKKLPDKATNIKYAEY